MTGVFATEAYERYAKARDKAKKSDYAVSKETSIGSATFSDWKAGRYMPKIDKLARIAAAVGTTASAIYGETL